MSWPASVPPSSPSAPVTRIARTVTCVAETPVVTKHTLTSGNSSGISLIFYLIYIICQSTFKIPKLCDWWAVWRMEDRPEMLPWRPVLWRGWGWSQWAECLWRCQCWEQERDQWSQSDITQRLRTYNYQRVFPRIPWSRYVDRKVMIIAQTSRWQMTNNVKFIHLVLWFLPSCLC